MPIRIIFAKDGEEQPGEKGKLIAKGGRIFEVYYPTGMFDGEWARDTGNLEEVEYTSDGKTWTQSRIKYENMPPRLACAEEGG